MVKNNEDNFFVTNAPFYKKYYSDLYIEEISKKFNIELWNGLRLYPERYQKIQKLSFPKQIDNVVDIKNFNDLENKQLEQ
jgi:hypothetical protein